MTEKNQFQPAGIGQRSTAGYQECRKKKRQNRETPMTKRIFHKTMITVCLILALVSSLYVPAFADEGTLNTGAASEQSEESVLGSSEPIVNNTETQRNTEESGQQMEPAESQESIEEKQQESAEESGLQVDSAVESRQAAKNNSVMAINSLRTSTEITGTLPDSITGLDQLYYGSVEDDSTAPFHNAEELQNMLENGEETYAKAVWKKYRYDLYDPNFQGRGGCGALVIPSGEKYNKKNPDTDNSPDYADELLETTSHEYPKDGDGPFHADVSAKIEPVENGTLVNGALVESDENDFALQKTASPDEGDSNQNREYTIDLKATPDLKQVKPVVFIFQIQTSWQMFDKTHANDRASLVNGKAVTQDLLSLYEMKQGFLDFMDWMKNYTDGSLMLGITNFQHGGTHSMIESPYFTNDADSIMEGLYGWDSFGDCEHIHYSNGELKNAQKQLNNSSNFTNWTDADGNSIYNNAEMISIIVGGACEAKDLSSGSVNLPTIPDGVIKHQYGIRTNSGTGAVADDMISWIDYCAQGSKKTAGAFNTGEYYKNVVTREQFFETLKSIYANVQEKAPNEQKVSNVKVEDTVTAEFDVNISAIKAYVGGQDVTDRANIRVNKQSDGTTKVSCEFGTVANGKEVHLQIPVQAKDDFIGSNNVLTNQGTPTISYQGRIDGTSYTQKFTSTPAVNVPIRFRVDDGETADVEAGKNIDLSGLAKDSSDAHIMTNAVENSLNKYSQIEGTLTYQWVDDQGNPAGSSTSAVINQDSRMPPEILSYTVNTKEDDAGKTETYKLRVTFTPAEVRSETTSKTAVGAGTGEGIAGIRIIQKQEGRVDKGEDVVITVHNKYTGKSFFHASDTVTNIFQHK